MSPVELVEALEALGLSSRSFARILGVSPMWVSRRTTGQTPISTEDELLIREALARHALSS